MYSIKIHIAGNLLQLSILSYNVYISFKKVKYYVKDEQEYRKSAATRCCLSLNAGVVHFYDSVYNVYTLMLNNNRTTSSLVVPEPCKHIRGLPFIIFNQALQIAIQSNLFSSTVAVVKKTV